MRTVPSLRHGHTGSSAAGDLRVGAVTKTVLAACVCAVGGATVLGLMQLWPTGTLPAADTLQLAAPGVTFPTAVVTHVAPYSCPTSATGGQTGERLNPNGSDASKTDRATCARVAVTVSTGRGKGDKATVTVSNVIYDAGIYRGQHVQLARIPTPPVPGVRHRGPAAAYSFADFQRGIPLFVLALLFAVVVVAVARLRGLLALVGIAVALIVLLKFMLPALLLGRSGFAVGLVGASAIMLIVLYLAHGVSVRTTTALIGTLVGVALTSVFGLIAVHVASLTGLSSDDTGLLSAVAGPVDLLGLLTCGIVLAGLGVLNDVTITQASAVWELREANPRMPRLDLYRSAMRIGRDHIASTVYTIVFAYAGATLPSLLLIDIYHAHLSRVVVSEAIAEEIVRTLASGVGLVLAVPFTTLIAVAAIPAPLTAIRQSAPLYAS